MVEVSRELSRKMANMAFFCSILVMLIHFPDGDRHGNVISMFFWDCFPGAVLRVAVPFFFCAAGFWFAGRFNESRWWRQAVISRVKSLLIPYFLLNGIWFVWILVYGGGIGSVDGVGEIMHKVCEALGFVRGEYPALPHLWFMWRLFLLVLVSPVCWLIINKGSLVAYVTAAIIYVLLAGRALYIAYGEACVPSMLMPFRYIIPPVGLVGFMVGATMRIYGMPQIRKRSGALLAILGFGILLLSHTIAHEVIVKTVLFYAGVPVFLLGLWVCMPAIAAPNWIVRNTFAIYIFHWVFFWIVDKCSAALGCRDGLNTIWAYFILPSLAAVVSCGLAEFLKKSKTLGFLLLGGR